MRFPTLLQVSNFKKKRKNPKYNNDKHHWFNIKSKINSEQKNNYVTKDYDCLYTHTKKIILDLDDKQKKTLNLWFDDGIDVYNYVNQYLKDHLNSNNHNFLLKKENLRPLLNSKLREICAKNKLDKHVADHQLSHCIAMYKSSRSNLKNKMKKEKTNIFDFSRFNVKDLCKDRRKKNLTIEPGQVSKVENSIFKTNLGTIKSNLPLNIIKKESVLQYDKEKNSYCIIVPFDGKHNVKLEQYKKCGIDIGVRTFLTTYSPEETHEIGTKEITYKKIDMYNKKLDTLQILHDEKKMEDIKYEKTSQKYRERLRNYIDDMHNKSSRFLLERYETINIGKVSTKSMVSNLTGNIQKITKRRLMALSHYRFRMKLKQMSVKWNCKINEVSEYMTSRKCSNCGKIKNNLGDSKLYECEHCHLSIDRDINAAINIYNI